VSAARVAVTGGVGFIGRWTVQALADRGVETTVLDLPERPSWLPGSVRYVRGSVDDPRAVESAIAGADRACHLAFRMDLHGDDPLAGARANVLGTTLVMDTALRSGLRRLVWASSVMVYGPREAYPDRPIAEDAEPMPRTHYGATKLALEWTGRAYRAKGLETVGLRFTTVFGPGRERSGAAPFAVTLFEGAARGGRVSLPGGERRAAMLYGPDAAQASVNALLASMPLREVYNVNGFETSVRELAQCVRRECPDAQVDVGAGGASPWPTAIDCRAAERELGYAPEFDRERSVAHYLAFLQGRTQARHTT
jgi:nucleoside-diphosphate-sugar epimerase